MSAPFTVVVVTHDSADDLRRLLASLAAHLRSRPPVVVVDTGSRDASVDVVRAAGAKVLLRPDNPGFGAANNDGVARVETPVTVLLNPDVELRDDGVARLAGAAAGHRALFVPRLVGDGGHVQDSAHLAPGGIRPLVPALLGPALPRAVRARVEPWRGDRPHRVGWAIAAALAAPTALLRELGPFDPDAFLFFEDMDLCLRAAARGAPTVLVPDVVLRHRGAHSTRAAFAGEPHALLARRRRAVVAARLGRRALALDDLAQGLTFATRVAARRALRRPADRPRAQLAALNAARAGRR